MRYPRVLFAALFALVGLAIVPRTAMAATVPEIQGTLEVDVPGGGGRMLLVFGKHLNRVTAFELDGDDGTPIAPLTIVFKMKTVVGLVLPATLVSPTYRLPGGFFLKFTTRTATNSVRIRLAGGRAEDGGVGSAALEAALRADLDDAVTVGSETLTDLHDSSLLVGPLPTSVFSAYDDLVAESRVGTGADQVAAGNHDHDARYPLRTDLNTVGTINNGGNPVDWTRLNGVPAGFADGTDADTTYTNGTGLGLTGTTFSVLFAGSGGALTVASSDHDHDARYPLRTDLNTVGTINNAGNPLQWSRLMGVPADFADGVDGTGSFDYTAGNGLTLTVGMFSVSFAGTGTATTAARSDHTHSNYLNTAGGTLSGTLTISSSSQAIIATSGTSSGTAGGIDCTTSGGIGVAGHGNIGVLGDLDSDGSFGVEGRCAFSGQVGVYAYASGSNGIALKANSTGDNGMALYASKSGNGDALVVSKSTYNTAGYYKCYYDYYGYYTCYYVNGQFVGQGNLAVFSNGSNQARIDINGTGFFNGGVYGSGADFAESVKVDRPSSAFEPGDVVVIDPKSPRQFALSTEAESALVAGVISTRPAVVGTTHEVAGEETAWKSGEVMLGSAGIVPTKICDEGGPIRIGDLLVTSSVPGHAKKAPPNPAVGTVIGKALGALGSGRGKIEVLLMAR